MILNKEDKSLNKRHKKSVTDNVTVWRIAHLWCSLCPGRPAGLAGGSGTSSACVASSCCRCRPHWQTPWWLRGVRGGTWSRFEPHVSACWWPLWGLKTACTRVGQRNSEIKETLDFVLLPHFWLCDVVTVVISMCMFTTHTSPFLRVSVLLLLVVLLCTRRLGHVFFDGLVRLPRLQTHTWTPTIVTTGFTFALWVQMEKNNNKTKHDVMWRNEIWQFQTTILKQRTACCWGESVEPLSLRISGL